MAVLSKPLTLLGLLGVAAAAWVDPATLDACPGYKATNVENKGSTLTADLTLAGQACNVFGSDIQQLKLQVTYETGTAFLFAIRGLPTDLTASTPRHPNSCQDH
jgi:hypothetical protein